MSKLTLGNRKTLTICQLSYLEEVEWVGHELKHIHYCESRLSPIISIFLKIEDISTHNGSGGLCSLESINPDRLARSRFRGLKALYQL